MEKNSVAVVAVAGIVLALILACAGLIYIAKDSNDAGTFSVTGNGQISVDPDQATLFVAIQANDTTAAGVQEQHVRIHDAVRESLIDAGIAQSDIETASYSLYPRYSWEDKEQKSVFSGYELVHILKVRTNDTGHVGKYVDAAIGAGANRIDSVQFELSKPKLKAVREQAFAIASDNAKEKAKMMSSELGVRPGKITNIMSYDNHYGPYYGATNMKYDSSSRAGNSIMPANVDVSVDVSLTYELE